MLGIGTEGGYVFEPKFMASFGGMTIKRISTLLRSGTLVLENGSAFVWGRNLDGELGLGHSSMVCRPILHPTVKNSHFSLGTHHSLILTRNGQLFSSGKTTVNTFVFNLAWSTRDLTWIGITDTDGFL